MPTIFTVDPRSGVPVYLQLVDQVKRAVALGTLASGEQLPTVKQLAADLTINPNTVARVYRELERDEVIETSPGRGSFVRGNSNAPTARRTLRDVAMQSISQAVREARTIGLNHDEIEELFRRAVGRWYPKTSRNNYR